MSEFLDTPELQDKVIVHLVDNDKDFLRSMKLMLEMMGWKVRDFSLAQDFLQEENFKVPGCIVLDMRMPGMTGFEVTKKLKTEFATSHIPIILLTALTSPDKHLEGLEAGADVYVTKPFSFKLLLAQVFRLIEQCEKLRKKFSSEPGVVRPALCNTDRDKEFADQLVAVVEKIYSQYNISIDEFAQMMGMGRTVFYKKLRGVTGYSPNEY